MPLSRLDEDGWELDDGEAIAAAHPDTFWMPPRDQREMLQPGQIVKLMFRIRTVDAHREEAIHVERMWVIIGGRDGGLYTGTLDNDPYCTDAIKAGLAVAFEARHVISIWEDGAS